MKSIIKKLLFLLALLTIAGQSTARPMNPRCIIEPWNPDCDNILMKK